jgi:hypothetical protein
MRAPSLRERAVGRHEAFDHRRDEPSRLCNTLSALSPERLGIGNKIAVHASRQFDRHLDGLIVGKSAKLKLCHGRPPSFP